MKQFIHLSPDINKPFPYTLKFRLSYPKLVRPEIAVGQSLPGTGEQYKLHRSVLTLTHISA